MSSYIAIARRPLLHILNAAGASQYGADQEWYPNEWQRKAGCSPTCCAHLLWYLAATRPACRPLCPWDGAARPGFTRLMEAVWAYVTPGSMGVNTTAALIRGALRYGRACGVPLAARVLEIPPAHTGRPTFREMAAFLAEAFEQDLPVAFLNLSAGALSNLDSWHWVTLVALRGGRAEMYNEGKRGWVNMARWLHTTTLGGGLVCLAPQPGRGCGAAHRQPE